MLGIRQVAVCVNKMDLVDYRQATFNAVRNEYAAFLRRVGIEPRGFIPVAARDGENLITRSGRMAWYDGPTVLELLDGFESDGRPPPRPCGCRSRTSTSSPPRATIAAS